MANKLKKLKVTDLQNILRERGVSYDKFKKASLVELCTAALELNIEVDPDGLLEDRDHVISSKLKKEKGGSLPNPGLLQKENHCVPGLPKVTIIDIYNYLTQCHFYTNESLRDYTRMEGYTMAIDNHCGDIESCQIFGHEGYYALSSKVRPRTRDEDPVTKLKYYSIWIIFSACKSRNTCIYSAYCVCKGGYVHYEGSTINHFRGPGANFLEQNLWSASKQILFPKMPP